MRLLGLGLALVLACVLTAVAVSAEEKKPEPPKGPPALTELDATRVEAADLKRRLTTTQLIVLDKARMNLEWELQEIRRQHEAAVQGYEALVADLAKAAGVDKATMQPNPVSKKWEPVPARQGR